MSEKTKVLEGKILGFEKVETDEFITARYHYHVTTWFSDGSIEHSKCPAYDVPMMTPIYKPEYIEKRNAKWVTDLFRVLKW